MGILGECDMRYITGIHALNLKCLLDTCGDWHSSALKWKDISFKESEETILKDWGIEANHSIPEHTEKYYVANHIRALLDLIADGKFSVAQGIREDYICNEKYTPIVLEMVWKLREQSNWEEIDNFMKKEYKLDWIKFKEEKGDAKSN